MWKAMPN
ncbi:hypothetical protein LINPERPRIM_LOCUS2149 [Linum perenne]